MSPSVLNLIKQVMMLLMLKANGLACVVSLLAMTCYTSVAGDGSGRILYERHFIPRIKKIIRNTNFEDAKVLESRLLLNRQRTS